MLSSGGYAYVLKDYSTHILFGEPKEGQKLEDVEQLLLNQLSLLKKGEFPDWLMSAVITDMKFQKTKEWLNRLVTIHHHLNHLKTIIYLRCSL